MPELPEVETIKRSLEKQIVNKKIKEVDILYPRLINTNIDEFKSVLVNKTINSLSRKGKFLIFNIEEYALLIHFRMEGKFYFTDDLKSNLIKATLMYFVFNDNTYLLFQDTRKFGAMYLYKQDELENSPIANLGKEPWDITSTNYLLNAYKNKNTLLKESLLDQSIIAGLGNIYTDEVCYKARLNPFMKVKDINKLEASRIIACSRDILDFAIKHNGSTVKSFSFGNHKIGDMQNYLKVYGKKGQECEICHNKIEKRTVNGRGTSYCFKCQHVFPSIAITGKMASGKSVILSYLKEQGYHIFSCDEAVHELYDNKSFIKVLLEKFPQVNENNQLSKKKVISNMLVNKKFRREYQNFIWKKVYEMINNFIITHTDNFQFIEVPLLFDAKFENHFTYILGVETAKQMEHLKARNDENIEGRLTVANSNSYDKNIDKLTFRIINNGDKNELIKEIDKVINQLKDMCFLLD